MFSGICAVSHTLGGTCNQSCSSLQCTPRQLIGYPIQTGVSFSAFHVQDSLFHENMLCHGTID